jgi:hypothetical protein
MSLPKSKPTISPRPERSNDNDGDGVDSGSDQCPNSPVGQIVNKIGCLAKQDSNPDRDNDRVIDAKDKYLNTTNRRNVIDTNGGYVKVRKPVELSVLLQFDFDSYATAPEHTNEVKKLLTLRKSILTHL